MKRLLDIFVSGILILLLLIPGLLVMLILRLTGEGKVFYRQPRVGRHGKMFDVLKFVTMKVGSESQGNKDITVRNDSRVLPFGRVLRKTKINELPQLINILKGDMSLVGWRPLGVDGFSDYSEEIQQQIVKATPGLTGIGSIVFRDEEGIIENTTKDLDTCYREDIAPYKGKLELWYNERRSMWMDFKVLICTAIVVFIPGTAVYQFFFRQLPEPDPHGEIHRIRNLEKVSNSK